MCGVWSASQGRVNSTLVTYQLPISVTVALITSDRLPAPGHWI